MTKDDKLETKTVHKQSFSYAIQTVSAEKVRGGRDECFEVS